MNTLGHARTNLLFENPTNLRDCLRKHYRPTFCVGVFERNAWLSPAENAHAPPALPRPSKFEPISSPRTITTSFEMRAGPFYHTSVPAGPCASGAILPAGSCVSSRPLGGLCGGRNPLPSPRERGLPNGLVVYLGTNFEKKTSGIWCFREENFCVIQPP